MTPPAPHTHSADALRTRDGERHGIAATSPVAYSRGQIEPPAYRTDGLVPRLFSNTLRRDCHSPADTRVASGHGSRGGAQPIHDAGSRLADRDATAAPSVQSFHASEVQGA